MNDSGYETAVTAIVGEAAYTMHKEALLAVDAGLRQRVISSIKLGLSIPAALAEVQRSAILPDENYNRYIRYIAANSGD